jgi:hypothetical protein
MAVVIDSEMPSATDAGRIGGSPLTFSFTNTAGTLLVVMAQQTGANPGEITAVSYGGDALTEFVHQHYLDPAYNYVSIWYRLNPKTGSNTVSVTCPYSPGTIRANAISFTGQHATTPLINGAVSDVGYDSFVEITLTGTVAGNIVLMAAQGASSYNATDGTLSSRGGNDTNAGNATQLAWYTAGGSVTCHETMVNMDYRDAVACEIQAGGAVDSNFFFYPYF